MSDTTTKLLFAALAVVLFGGSALVFYRKLRWVRGHDRSGPDSPASALSGAGEERLSQVGIAASLLVMVITVAALLIAV
jgi:hypothetical protein